MYAPHANCLAHRRSVVSMGKTQTISSKSFTTPRVSCARALLSAVLAALALAGCRAPRRCSSARSAQTAGSRSTTGVRDDERYCLSFSTRTPAAAAQIGARAVRALRPGLLRLQRRRRIVVHRRRRIPHIDCFPRRRLRHRRHGRAHIRRQSCERRRARTACTTASTRSARSASAFRFPTSSRSGKRKPALRPACEGLRGRSPEPAFALRAAHHAARPIHGRRGAPVDAWSATRATSTPTPQAQGARHGVRARQRDMAISSVAGFTHDMDSRGIAAGAPVIDEAHRRHHRHPHAACARARNTMITMNDWLESTLREEMQARAASEGQAEPPASRQKRA